MRVSDMCHAAGGNGHIPRARPGHTGAEYRQAGASLLEFAVAAAVLGVLAVTLLGRLLYAQEYAEKVAMEVTIANMRAGLRAQVGALLMADKTGEIGALAGTNPMQWLDEPPQAYLGEFRVRPRGDLAGAWYFDSVQRELVYTANLHRHFSSSGGAGHSVRLKVLPVSNAVSAASAPEPAWVQLAVLDEYRWF